MKYISISVVLIILASVFSFGCQGDPNNTGTPVFSLPENKGAPPQTSTGPRLNAIVIEPDAVNLEQGGNQVYKAIGYFSDNAVIDMTGTVIWYSTNESVGTLSDKGIFNAAGVGYAGIGAFFQQGSDNLIYADFAFANVFAPGELPPLPVRNVKAQLAGNSALISWTFSPESNIKGYNVYRSRTSGTGYDIDAPLNEDLIILNHFTDINPGGGVLYYVVAAVNEDDVIGVFSHEAELDFNPEPPWEE
ncbi:MAG: Ig-like domain-containing protein [bacterium]